MVDKNKAVIDYLTQCEDIADSPLYFNLINAEDNSIQMITTAEDKSISRTYVDGSKRKRYTFNLITFKTISDKELVVGYSNENVDELQDVQKLIDWISEQQDLHNYPDFGEECIIDSIDTTTDIPRYDGINVQMNPPLAMYTISIVIEYLDISKQIWNK